MVRRFAIAALALVLSVSGTLAQQPSSPVPLLPGPPPPSSMEPQPLPSPADALGVSRSRPESPSGADAGPPPGEAPAARIFCDQPVTVRLAERNAVPERYRRFVGIWSDAAWTPQLCAALIVENVAPDGTATITYAFGPMGSNARGSGGVLNGTGIVRDGELRFQNSDGSQFAFRPLYADLQGQLTTPQGQKHDAIFKKTL